MTTEKKTQFYLEEFKDSHEISDILMKTKHYEKLGKEGIFLAVQMAKVLGIHPMQAVNGGVNIIQGKVEIGSALLASLIRRAGHSVVKSTKSNSSFCTLKGKRKDNGDEMIVTYTMDDAKVAGLTKNPTWTKHPADMLYARAMSRLAKQLFGDIFMMPVYGEDEIAEAIPTANIGEIEIESPAQDQQEGFIKAESQLKTLLERESIPSEQIGAYLACKSDSYNVSALDAAKSALDSPALFTKDFSSWLLKREESTI